MYDNGVAGIHVMGSNNFTFEATIAPADECYGDPCVVEGEGNVGSLDGQQPIEVIIETSTDVKFTDMRVQSVNGKSVVLFPVLGVAKPNALGTGEDGVNSDYQNLRAARRGNSMLYADFVAHTRRYGWTRQGLTFAHNALSPPRRAAPPACFFPRPIYPVYGFARWRQTL